MFCVKYNKASNELLDIQDEIVIDDNTLVDVKYIDGDKPDMTKYKWSPEILNFILRVEPVSYSISKIAFRRRFTFEQQMAVDEFNETFMSLPYLDDNQKRFIRTGLNNYKETSEVNLKDEFVPMLLDLYISLGIITDLDKQRIMEIN